jgi:DNA-binding response OmpR family regulator
MARKSTGPCRILVVEFNTDYRETLVDLLTLWGQAVEPVSSFSSGLQKVIVKDFDVAIVALGRRRQDGFDFAKRVRAQRLDVTMIAMTGWTGPRDRKAALDAGFNYYLIKPVDPQKLMDILRDNVGCPIAAAG